MMNLDQELEGFADYANDDVRALFNSFNTDEDRRWAWFVLLTLQILFPKLDHQTKYNWEKTQLEIVIGIQKNFLIYFRLIKEKTLDCVNLILDPNFIKYRRKKSYDMIQNMQDHNWIIDSKQFDLGNKKRIVDKIKSFKELLDRRNINLSGETIYPKFLSSINNIVFEKNTATTQIILVKNTIFYGPPGTGKTYKTIDKALEIIDPSFYSTHKNENTRKALKERFDKLREENKIVMTTFHQSYSYEDFVEGLSAESKEGQLVYGIKKGIFKTICENSKKSPDENFVLIIDEINRGNVSNIFGELITLIEDSKRAGKDEALSVTLPYSKETFSVPSNLYIVGTMNTADRSLTQIDTALRRRFHFEEMMPNPNLLEGLVIDNINICNLLKCLNERIEALYDREHTLGHAFFMELLEEDKKNIDTLAAIFKNKVIPLLQEYFFDDWGKIQLILGEQVIKEKAQFSNFATSNINNLVIPKAYEIVSGMLKEPDTYITMYKNCLSV